MMIIKNLSSSIVLLLGVSAVASAAGPVLTAQKGTQRPSLTASQIVLTQHRQHVTQKPSAHPDKETPYIEKVTDFTVHSSLDKMQIHLAGDYTIRNAIGVAHNVRMACLSTKKEDQRNRCRKILGQMNEHFLNLIFAAVEMIDTINEGIKLKPKNGSTHAPAQALRVTPPANQKMAPQAARVTPPANQKMAPQAARVTPPANQKMTPRIDQLMQQDNPNRKGLGRQVAVQNRMNKKV